MRSTKTPSSSPSVLASRTLKTVGVIIILATLLDIIILPMPYNLGDRQWQISFVTQVVDRGIVPLVGMVLFLLGYWIDSTAGTLQPKDSFFQDPRFWAFVLASALGAFYLVLFPLHLNNARLGNEDALKQITEQATQAETELGNRLNTEITSQRQQINQLLGASDEQLTQLQTAGQLSKEQADLIRKFKGDPKSLEPFLNDRIEKSKAELQNQIALKKQEGEQKIKSDSLKSGLRVGISSLLLAIAFIVIGWTGLRNLGQI